VDHLGRLAHLESLPRFQPVGEGAPVGVRHHQVGAAIGEHACVVDGDDVRGVDPAEVAALLHEASADVVVLGPVVGEDLHRHG
jgi:hypothetical protein